MATKLNDTQALRVLRDDIQKALTPVSAKHGVSLALGNCTYSRTGNSAHFKLEVVSKDMAGDAAPENAKAAADWKSYALVYGLKPEWLGKTFYYGGKPVKILGLMPKRRKFPVLVEMAGREGAVLLPIEPVIACIEREEREGR